MAAEISPATSDSSFLGLQSYSENQTNIFFGRDNEISHLVKLVNSNTLTIVFGRSGTGKTSLLNAGVFPKLRKEYCLPFRIRLEFAEDSPGLIAQIKNVLRAEIEKYGFGVESFPTEDVSLWEYFHREPLWKSVTPILVFDQFEEMFTLARKNARFSNEELPVFWSEMSDVIENEIPDSLKEQFLHHKEEIGYNYKFQPVKVLFAFREEFLPEFESIPVKIPSIRYSRFRLLPMQENQAYDVVTKTWKEKIAPEQARKIVSYFTTSSASTGVAEIEPSLLSQVCLYLDRQRIAKGKEKITAGFLDEYPRDTILRSIYNQAIIDSNTALPAPENKTGNEMQMFVEEKLITNEGYRTRYAMSNSDDYFKPGVAVLASKYFIREDGKVIELTHDVLAPIIKEDREARQKVLAQQEENRKARKKAVVIVKWALALGLILGLGFWGFGEWRRELAREKEKDAQIRTAALNKEIALQTDSLEYIIDQKKKERNRNGGGKGFTNNNDRENIVDTPTNANYIADSGRIDDLEAQLQVLTQHKNDLENERIEYDKRINQYIEDNKSLGSLNNSQRQNISRLDREVSFLNNKIAGLEEALDRTRKEFMAYRLKYPKDPKDFDPVKPRSPEFSDTNSLKLNIFYSFKKPPEAASPQNITIYCIPDIPANRTIIREARLYQIRCDYPDLEKAQGYRTAIYANGQYVFPDLPKGKYFIKICTYYGGWYYYDKTQQGTFTERWDASPPIWK